MPSYINDPEVDKLIAKLVGLTRTSEIEADKAALEHEIARRKSGLPMRDWLAKSLAMAQSAGRLRPAIISPKSMRCGARTDAIRRHVGSAQPLEV